MSARQMVENNMTTKNITTNSNITFFNKSNLFEAIHNRVKSKDKGSTVMIPHICNNVGLFGGGFTAGISKYFPIVKENFHMLGASSKLGTSQYVSVFRNAKYNYEIIFCNMIVENMNTDISRNLNYGALVYSMVDIKHYIHKYKQLNDNIRVEIHCPKIGSGSAGGNWHFVEALIEDIWNGTDVFAYFPNKKDSHENH